MFLNLPTKFAVIPKNILVIRLSAMGDVAMSVPVIRAVSEQYPHAQILFLTRKTFNPFFEGIENLTLINPDLKGEHKGVAGLFKLFLQIKKQYKPSLVLDIHDVLRTKILRTFFRFSGVKISVIDKGRAEKKALTRRENKILKPLRHSTLRYADVFEKAGISLKLNKNSVLKPKISDKLQVFLSKDKKNIGIAPFAMHLQKQYPIEKSEKLINLLTQKGYRVLIFGGGKKELQFAEKMEQKHEDVFSIIGKFKLADEIALISRLDLMISMDSANMHIAALTGIHILSIWGGTHPFAGFTPFIADDKSHIIQRNDLDCRPCSVFGSKACFKSNLECFDINPEKIIDKIESISSILH
jgi:ADP-heptose:LPS heptosyltransferase